jgi:hypothetical protein
LAGQIENAGTPLIVVEFQPAVTENGDKLSDGVLGGAVFAFIVIVLLLEFPFGSFSVSVTEYVPLGNVSGKGVRSVEVV